MNTIRRPLLEALALTLSALVLASCAAATPTDSPSASASPFASAEAPSGAPSALPSASPSASVSPTVAPTVTPTPRTTPDVVAWHRAPDAATPGIGDWQAMSGGFNKSWTKLGDLYVLPMDEEDPAQVWTSRDLLHWTKRTLPTAAGEVLGVKAVSLGGPGLVAIGEGYTDPDSTNLTAYWTSTDGVTWKRVQDTGLTPGQLWLLFATGEGNVTYLTGPADVTEFPGAPFTSNDLPAMVVSQGGVTAFTQQSDTKKPVEMWQAIGTNGWHKVQVLPKSSNGGYVKFATQGPRGYFAFGCNANCAEPAGWTSSDGIAWRTASMPDIDEVNAIVAVESGFIAVGQRVTGLGCAVGESEIFGVTWASPDGRQWKKMKEEAQFNRAAIHVPILQDGTLYGLGIRWPSTGNGPVSTVWTAPLPADSVATVPAAAPTPAPGHTGCGD